MSDRNDNLIRIHINGAMHSVDAERTVLQTLIETGYLKADAAPTGMALAVNQAVVPAAAWDEQTLADGDCLQLFQAIAGG